MQITKAARVGRDRPEGFDAATLPKRKPGRPREPGTPATKATLPFAYLARAATIMENVLARPRSRGAQKDLADLAADIRRRLAPVADPGNGQHKRGPRGPIGWDVGLTDGSVHRASTIAEAAVLYGVKTASLNAMLAHGGTGYTRRKVGDGLVWCRRVYADNSGAE